MTELKPLVLGYDSIHPFAKVDITDRASVQELLRTLLDPLKTHFSPLKARIRTPGGSAVRFDQTAAEIEGTCRPLWGLAALIAGGGEYDGTAWWIEALKQGKSTPLTLYNENSQSDLPLRELIGFKKYRSACRNLC